MTLSVLVIARDEEELIPDCLASLWDENAQRIFDELIVVVAAESTDRTAEIAATQFGATVYSFGPWPLDADGNEQRDYAAVRNFAESKATCEYILWIDADEQLATGHEAIREIVAAGVVDSVRPIMALHKPDGEEFHRFVRQDLLHRRGSHVWKGRRHEYTEGPLGDVDRRILYMQNDRAGGDRPHADEMALLRADLDTLEGDQQRSLFYLARDHYHADHWTEAVALFDLYLVRPGGIERQRSFASVMTGDACKHLEDYPGARNAYLRAVQEDASWAEPYFCMGMLCAEQQNWMEALAWLTASTVWEPNGASCSTNVYTNDRWDALVIVLTQLGRLDEANATNEFMLTMRPDDARLLERRAGFATRPSVAAGAYPDPYEHAPE